MPRLSVWFVRAALVYFLLGFTFGAEGHSVLHAGLVFVPVHMEYLVIGWFTQLAMGVAFRFFPRFGSGPPRVTSAGSGLPFLP